MKMKRYFAMFAAAVAALLVCAQNAAGFPGERIFDRTAHFAHRVAYKVDNHVIHPVTHGIGRHLR
jgi:hypothetical protein